MMPIENELNYEGGQAGMIHKYNKDGSIWYLKSFHDYEKEPLKPKVERELE
jgi:hypothetical protein